MEPRGEFGHWKMDTVVSGVKGRGGLLVLCERKTRFAILEKLETISQAEVARALKRIIRRWYRKGTDFQNVSAAKVGQLQSFINSIPHLATLKGKTANEAFNLAA